MTPKSMLRTLKLLLPAIIPSWRFFDMIAPSPRIEFTLLATPQDTAPEWREFRPRPDHLGVLSMLGRMLWNPSWNESLFLVSCAERLIKDPTEHSIREISNRIGKAIARSTDTEAAPYLQFRLVFISRNGEGLQKDVLYLSSPCLCSEGAGS